MKLNKIFSSNMVFAARLPIRIYGTGEGNAWVTFAGQTKTVTADKDEWLVELSPMEYGGPYELVFDDGNETVRLRNIYVGEVYLFAGQSNIELKMKTSSTDPSFYETNGNLRLFSTDRIDGPDFYTAQDGWVTCEKEKVGEWSDIAYLAGIQLVKSKDVAVGAIACYQGTSVIESWVPKGTFEKKGINIPLNQKQPSHSEYAWNEDGKLYSSVFSQVIPFSVSAVVWYQGESDSSPEEAKVYRQELSLMMDIWRKDLRNANLPFVVIQIADYSARDDEAWKTIQKAQQEIQYVCANVTTIASADVCEKDDIHPPTKEKLSKRVACALASLSTGRCDG